MAGTRKMVVAFIGEKATATFNSYVVNPKNPAGPTIPSQSRREYVGENSAAQVQAFAQKLLGDTSLLASELAPGVYEVTAQEQLPLEAPAKKGK